MSNLFFSRFIFIVAGACFYLGLLSSVHAVTHSQVERYSFFDLPSQPLSQGLIEFALQADIEVIAQLDQLRGMRNRPVFGYFTKEGALKRLLGRAPLSFQFLVAENVYLIVAQPQEEVLTEGIGAHNLKKADRIESVTVIGSKLPFRYQTILNSTNQNGVALFDSARFHSVVPNELLRDQSFNTIVDALKSAGGVTEVDRLSGSNDDYIFRGFTRNNLYLDSFRLSDNTATQVMPENVERIDILKGPSMLFYGQSSPGGVVDVSRKKASPENYTRVMLRGSDSGQRRSAIEVNSGELMSSESVVRLSLVDDIKSQGLDSNEHHRQVYSVGVSTQVKDYLSASLNYEYQHLNQVGNREYPVLTLEGQFLPATVRSLVPQHDNLFVADIDLVSTSLDFTPSKNWRVHFSALLQREGRYGVRLAPGFLLDSDVLINQSSPQGRVDTVSIAGQMAVPIRKRFNLGNYQLVFGDLSSIYDQEEAETDASFRLAVNGRFMTKGIEHRAIVGVDAYQQDLYQAYVLYANPAVNGVSLEQSELDLDLARIKLAERLSIVSGATESDFSLKSYKNNRSDKGLYFQLHSRWTERWSTSVGGRYSKFDGSRFELGNYTSALNTGMGDLSLQLGTSYEITDSLSLFSNYSEAIAVRYLLDDYGEYAEGPEVSEQKELGLKWFGFDGKVLATLAGFGIHNTQIYDMQQAAGYRTLVGPFSQKVQGVECDLIFHWNDNIDFIFSSSITKNQLKSRESGVGVPALVADNTHSFRGRYSSSNLWSTTLGIYQISDRSLDSEESLKLEGYSVVDFTLGKQLDLWGSEIHIKFLLSNVMDEKYKTSVIEGVRVNSNVGREVGLQLELVID